MIQVVAVMGVAGAGKTTIGKAIAQSYGWAFVDADSLHSPANIAKMAAGHPLDDADRLPWLDEIAAWVRSRLLTGQPGVVACSLLKRAYRTRVLDTDPRVALVCLCAPLAELHRRLANRLGHFMPAELLRSQVAALEPPGADEHPICIEPLATVDQTVDAVLARLAPRMRRESLGPG